MTRISSVLLLLCLPLTVYTLGKKVTLVSTENCTPVKTFDRTNNLTYSYHVWSRKINRNTTVIDFNVTVWETTDPIRLTLRGYQLKANNKKVLMKKFEKLPCQQIIVSFIFRTIKLKLEKDCRILPGTYVTSNIDLESFKWFLTRAIFGSGRYSYELEFISSKGILLCQSIVYDVKNK